MYKLRYFLCSVLVAVSGVAMATEPVEYKAEALFGIVTAIWRHTI